MTVEEFQRTFGTEIQGVLKRISRRYGVTDDEMAGAFYFAARKYLADSVDQSPGSKKSRSSQRTAVAEFLGSLNLDDLCLAVACAKGTEEAWTDFYTEYRGYLINTARTMTQDPGAAEQLADSTFAELYGLRESRGNRVSKFSFYSGRGSLRGWLRAVIYQLSADLHRQTSRFVQTEEPEDLDRLRPVDLADRATTIEIAFVSERYRRAVSESLVEALGQLEAREKLLLVYYYYDEMTLREIGELFKVHEATISRWLSKIQKRTRKSLEKQLARVHGFNRREVSEAIQLAAEQLDISVREYLFQPASAERDREPAAENRGEVVAPR